MRLRSAAGLLAAIAVIVSGCGARDAVASQLASMVAPSPTPTATAAPTAAPTVAPTTAATATPAPSGTFSLSAATTIGTPSDDGARIIKVTTVDARMRDLTVESPNAGTVMVRIQLPEAYTDGTTDTFPALYLLHGADGQYTDWSTLSDAMTTTSSSGFLVVMPSGPSSLMGTGNGQGAGVGGRALWEPFLTDELTQLMERNWNASDRRVVAGLSLGGYGSIVLAARHPNMYDAVASFSGALDLKSAATQFIPNASLETLGQIQRIIDVATGFGTYSTQELAPLLRGTKSIYISYGNGRPGPLDPVTRRIFSPIEKWCGGGSDLFVAQLQAQGIKATVADYGDGTHSWPYWDRALRLALPQLLEAAGLPVPLASPGG